MSALDQLTVCVTSFRRPKFLERALDSVRAAGIRRVAIGAVSPTPETEAVISKFKDGWLSFDVSRVAADIGCNRTWMLAAYAARTPRILLLHDDDTLTPGLGAAYEQVIAPALDSGEAGFATWRAELLYEDGTTKATEFWHGPTRILDSRELLSVVGKRGRLSLSPILSVFDRQTLIHACKEAEQTLIDNECLLHPGMLLGTEILVYMRHIRAFPKWLYVDQVLSQYGSHAGSGTVDAERYGGIPTLAKGYDFARAQGEQDPPIPHPRTLLVFCPNDCASPEEASRNAAAFQTWQFLFDQGDTLAFPVSSDMLSRSGKNVGDSRAVPFIRDLFDFGCARAMPEDIVAYTNLDIGLTTLAPERLLEGVRTGNGVTVCARRSLTPRGAGLYKSVLNCKTDGGFDVMAVSPAWWFRVRDQMPDMLVGREAWDTCFRVLAEEQADGGSKKRRVTTHEDQWRNSPAYTDDVCWHQPHASVWRVEHIAAGGQAYNRQLAAKFFEERANKDMAEHLGTHVSSSTQRSYTRPRLVYAPTPTRRTALGVNHLCAVLTHRDAAETVSRHLPVWRAVADRVLFFSPTDSPMGMPDGSEVLIGRAEHHGEASAQRLTHVFRALLAERWDVLQLNEYDSLIFRLPASALPQPGGMAACWRPQNNHKFVAKGFPSFPMLFSREGLSRVVDAMEGISCACPDRAWSDRFVGLAAERAGVPILNLKAAGLAWHRNTIEGEDISRAVLAAKKGACMFHGVKSQAVFARLSGAVRRF